MEVNQEGNRQMDQYYLLIAGGVVLAGLAAVAAAVSLPKYRHVFRVPQSWAGLLYRDGIYVRRNNAGLHVVWGLGWTIRLMDLRKASLHLTDQEVITADNVGLKLSLLVTYRLAEPHKAAHETQNWESDLRHAAQVALPGVVRSVAAEAVLDQRLDIGAQLLARVHAEAVANGILVLAIEVQDVTIAAGRKRTFAEVLNSKRNREGALESTRGKSIAVPEDQHPARVLEEVRG